MIDAAGLGSLLVLALIDSTSFGTLLIPIWLLTSVARVRLGRMIAYLATVTLSYLALGIVLLLGADAFLDSFGDRLDSTAFLVGQLILGVALMGVSQLMDTTKARARAAERAANGGGRLLRWRGRIMGDASTGAGSIAALAGPAFVAVVVEAASMIPYLGAIGIIATAGLGWPGSGLLLLGYCLVMIAPALLLTMGRLVAHDALERPLAGLDRWLTGHAQATTAWIIGIVGFLLAVHAVSDLGWFGG